MFQGSRRLKAFVVLLAAALACSFVVIPLAQKLTPDQGFALALLSLLTCIGTSLIVAELFFRFHSTDTAYALAVAGQLIRMAFPLVACGAVWVSAGIQPARTLGICFVIVYPVLLAVETFLFVKELQPNGS